MGPSDTVRAGGAGGWVRPEEEGDVVATAGGAAISSNRASHGSQRYRPARSRGTQSLNHWSGRKTGSRATYGSLTSGYATPSKRMNGEAMSNSKSCALRAITTAAPSSDNAGTMGRRSGV